MEFGIEIDFWGRKKCAVVVVVNLVIVDMYVFSKVRLSGFLLFGGGGGGEEFVLGINLMYSYIFNDQTKNIINNYKIYKIHHSTKYILP